MSRRASGSPSTAAVDETAISRRGLLSGGLSFAAAGVLAGARLRAAEDTSPEQASAASGSLYTLPISLNTSTLRGYKLPITETIDIAADAGYAGIEPWPNEISDFTKAGGKLSELASRLRDKGLRVTGAIEFFRWMVDDDTERKRGLEDAKRSMEALDAIGATHVAAPPTGDVAEVDLLRAAERYRALLEVAESFGVVPAVEVWGFAKKLNRLGEVVLVAIEADHPRACILPDVYHLYKGGSGLGGVKFLGPKLIGGFHLNDYPEIPRETIQDKDRVYPGDGVAPLGEFFRDLLGAGYRGPVSVELFNPEYWKRDPREVAKTALEKTRASIARALTAPPAAEAKG